MSPHSAEASPAERPLWRSHALVAVALSATVALAWLYLLQGAGMELHQMDGMAVPATRQPWSLDHAALMLVMWAVMMVAMMLPSAGPMILLYATILRRRRAEGGIGASTGIFVSGYIAVWSGFSLAATMLQWSFDTALLLSPTMQTTSAGVAGVLLIAAGVYQWTPLKQACLRHCRSPLDFVLTRWREGLRGAFGMGLRHGAYCVGCCWLMMLLLFVGGVMSLAWIAGIAAFVLVEKIVPAGHWLSRVAGGALIAWGGATLWSLA